MDSQGSKGGSLSLRGNETSCSEGYLTCFYSKDSSFVTNTWVESFKEAKRAEPILSARMSSINELMKEIMVLHKFIFRNESTKIFNEFFQSNFRGPIPPPDVSTLVVS